MFLDKSSNFQGKHLCAIDVANVVIAGIIYHMIFGEP